MLPPLRRFLDFNVDVCLDVTTPWIGIVSEHLDSLNSTVLDAGGNVWIVTWDEDHGYYIGVPDQTWYVVHGKTPPALDSFLVSAVIH